ncbi:phosphotransferase enzyme family protein [Paenibacillus prosopidis]|uniref:Ser/Thr protein kinase RdoA (MazF antagonist) n=1 Tax=Paenibacillus prosopidis TaxID=630520 RepID=A0A368VHL1_9BACL|nr:phosphotransferase [Paenibacillus prosopidis]RCW40851.1 Ser/Thr protein kinase RdoA (MazF antagonist) [Paenibacillus prosopidis]
MDPKIKLMFLDEHAAEGAARYGVSPKVLTFIGGFQNFIYSYNRDELKYILRFTPSTLRTSEGLAAEIEWIRYLSENGLSVSEPVSSVNGKDFERIQGNMMDLYVTSFKHAPGRKIGYPECLGNSILYEECGRITGRLHELAKLYKPMAKRHTWECNEYLLRAEDYLPSELQPILFALDELRAPLASLPVNADNFGLIHGDINVGNFTVDESGEITLFDFDECQYSWYVEDVAIQLYYLLYVFGEDSKSERKVQYELFIKHFELGYTEDGRQMPDSWKDQLKLFLRLREIIVVVGMHRSWDLSQPDDWTRDFLQDSRMRITKGISLIDEF